MLKTILKMLLYLLLVIVLYFAGVIIYGSLTKYTPPDKKEIKSVIINDIIAGDTLTIFSWNLGYGGLGAEADFFYDGGKSLRVSKELTEKYHQGIEQFIKQQSQVDIFLLQEVDTLSRRSYYLNQLSRISNTISDYNYSFATNYQVNYVPMPLFNPMGKVRSGLANFSKFKPGPTYRYSLPGSFSWPTSLFFLRRCLMVQYYPLKNGNTLVAVNLHNSAYDEEGLLKKKELEFLRETLLDIYDENHFVIVGGDWNQPPPGFDATTFNGNIPRGYAVKSIPEDFMPEGWQWIYDVNYPTNRSLEKPYLKDETFTTLIDFFLVSPNVEVLDFKTIPLDFVYSDHEPFYIKVNLNR